MAEQKDKKVGRLPNARGYDITDGYAEKLIGETAKEHICRICKNLIPVGSRAKEIIQVINGKPLVHQKEYAHIRGQCLPITG